MYVADNRLCANTKKGVYNLPFKSIVFMEKSLRKIIIHTVGGSIEIYGSFSEIREMLDERFMCCHQSYIFNMDEIVAMCKGGVYFTTNEHVYLGRDTYARGRKELSRYLYVKNAKKTGKNDESP